MCGKTREEANARQRARNREITRTAQTTQSIRKSIFREGTISMKYLSAEEAIRALIDKAEEYDNEFDLLADAEDFASYALGILGGYQAITYKEEKE